VLFLENVAGLEPAQAGTVMLCGQVGSLNASPRTALSPDRCVPGQLSILESQCMQHWHDVVAPLSSLNASPRTVLSSDRCVSLGCQLADAVATPLAGVLSDLTPVSERLLRHTRIL
jgi:hypothetical protein